MSIAIPQADFTPQLVGYTGQGAFRFWCQKVLPIVYDDSLSYYELLCKVVAYLNNTIQDVATCEENIGSLLEAYNFLQTNVNEGFRTCEDSINTIQENVDNFIKYVDEFFNELIIKDARNLNSKTINPVYIGDFLMSNLYYPGACIKIGDSYYYILLREDAETNHSDDGVVRKFTLRPNRTVDGTTIPGVNSEDTSFTKQIKVGHANSMCYVPDTDMIYVAPVFTYEEYNPNNNRYYKEAPWLYTYKTEEFVYQGKLDTPTYAMGVSYDHVTKTLYYFDYYRNIYRYNDGEWELYCAVDYSNVPTYDYFQRSYNQDFAVYNNIAYISSPYGNIIYGILKPITTSIIGGLVVDTLDTSARWRLGELEGMEFTADGHLIASDVVELSSSCLNGLVLEIPVGVAPPNFSNIGGSFFGVHDGTLTLSTETQNAFSLRTYQIRSLQQLVALTLSGETSTVLIPNGSAVVDFANNIRITQDIQLCISGEYTANSITVFSGTFDIFGGTAAHKLTLLKSTGPIIVDRVGSIKFSGQYPIRISMPNSDSATPQLIDIKYSYATSSFRDTPVDADGGDKTFYIGDSAITDGQFVGSTNTMKYPPETTAFAGSDGCFAGCINDTNRSLRFTIPMPKALPRTNVTLMNTPSIKVYTSSGVNITSNGQNIDLSSSAYSVKCYRVFGSYVRVWVDIAGSGTFAKGLANTCVTVVPLSNFEFKM